MLSANYDFEELTLMLEQSLSNAKTKISTKDK